MAVSVPIDRFSCKICGSNELEEFHEFGGLCRVTSDCKPFAAGGRLAMCGACGAVQKPADTNWLAEIEEIYGSYAAYYQSSGVEQAVFDPAKGEPNTRSAAILQKLANVHSLCDQGNLLDVGCGNGVMLTAFSKRFPKWALHGQDLSEIALNHLSKIPGFRKLFTVPPEEIDAQFDMVTMIHSLEHFPDPIAGLKGIKPLVGKGGCLLVQVPNAEVNPFDYLVADHASHFTRADFVRLLKASGLEAPVITDEWVTKELSVVASLGQAVEHPDIASASPDQVRKLVTAQIDWLTAVVRESKEASDEGREFGIFGTSIAAMWLFGQLGDAVSFFVDEDESRRGTVLHGKPVYHPTDVVGDKIVYAGLIPHVARAVASRLAKVGIDMRVPPEIAIS
jgi:trans-aconitate methyltransferase